MAKNICLKIKRRGDFFRLGAQILRRFMGFYRLSNLSRYNSYVAKTAIVAIMAIIAVLAV